MFIFGGFCVCLWVFGGWWVCWVNMVVFLFFIFVVEDLCVLVGWVDIVCYYGVFNGCVFEFNL